MGFNNSIPTPTLRRLPVYHRIMQELFADKTERVSSRKLSELTGFTASQIRQDIGFIGNFGLQGYGYNVEELYNALSEKLKTSNPLKAVLIGAGNLGKAVSRNFVKKQAGANIIGVFDKNEAMSGKLLIGMPIRNVSVLEEFCLENKPDIAILCIPESEAFNTARALCSLGVKGILNFSGSELRSKFPEMVISDVNFSDSLLALRYYID